jgi:hypothetical protein
LAERFIILLDLREPAEFAADGYAVRFYMFATDDVIELDILA